MSDMGLSLVTGACGFIGSHMTDLLVEQGVRVRATDLPKADRTFLNPKAEFVPSDLSDPASLKGLCEGVDRIFHVAALFSYSAPFLALYRANVVGTQELLRKALEESRDLKSVVLWGAAGIYGPRMKPPVREDAPVEPGNDYLKTKYIQEQVALDLHRTRGLPLTIMRLASPYGPRARYGAYLSFRLIALGQAPPFLVGHGRNRAGGMAHVRDICRAADFLSRRPDRASGQVYNVCDDVAYTMDELSFFLGDELGSPFFKWPRIPVWLAIKSARDMEERFRRKGKVPPVPADMAEYANIDCVLDTSKLKALGFELLYPDCKKGIRETIAWYREKGWLPPLEDWVPNGKA